MQRRLVWAALLAVTFVALVPARSGAAVAPIVPCNVGAIVKLADPSLSAPSPAYPGSRITSSAGSWSSCGESFTGFYGEWLRDGNVISGPTWAAGLPGAFGYVVQAADVGHRLTSALRPCNPEGCFGSFASSSNAVIPAAAPPPPPPPQPPPPPPPSPLLPMQLYFDEGVEYSVTDESGNLVSQQSLDNLPDGSYEISPNGGTAGAYSESTAQPLLDSITGATSSISLGVAKRLCYTVDKHRTAHEFVTSRVVWRFHHKVHWCATYPAIDTNSLTVDSFFSDVDPVFQVDWDDRGTGWSYTWRGSPIGGHYSRRQGKIDDCIFKWGCIGSHYPQIELWVNGNGAWAAK